MQHRRAAGVGEADVVEGDLDRALGQPGARRPRVDHVGGGVQDADHAPPAGDGVLGVGEHLGAHLHRADEQRHQEREGEHLADGDLAVDAEQHAEDQHAGVGQAGRDATQGERERGQPLGAGAGLLVAVDRGVDAYLGAVLDRVGADHGRAHDGLADRAEHDADLAPYDAVGLGQPALEVAQAQEQRQEADPDHQGQLPGVERHHHGGDQDLADADDRDHAAEDQELADLVDVGGDPGDQRAAPLGVLGEQRQVVDVPERLDPQGRQAALGRGEQPVGHRVGRDAGDHDRDARDRRHRAHEGQVRAAGAADALVEGLLHRDGYDDPADGRDGGQQQRAEQAVLELGRELHAAGDRRPGGDRLAGVHPCRRAHRAASCVSVSGCSSS